MNYNKTILGGTLTRDPELRQTTSGKAICGFGLACNRKRQNAADEVLFVDVTAFDKQAEIISQHFRKGQPILLEGRLKLDQWNDKQTGAKRSKIGVVLEGFTFIGAKKDSSTPPIPESTRSAPETVGPPPESDDPPF